MTITLSTAFPHPTDEGKHNITGTGLVVPEQGTYKNARFARRRFINPLNIIRYDYDGDGTTEEFLFGEIQDVNDLKTIATIQWDWDFNFLLSRGVTLQELLDGDDAGNGFGLQYWEVSITDTGSFHDGSEGKFASLVSLHFIT